LSIAQNPWRVVFGSTLALVVGNGPVMQFTFGVFLKPLTSTFHVDRGFGSLAITIGVLATAISLPVAGRLVDRHGPRRSALVAVLLFAAGVAMAGLLSKSIWSFMLLFSLAGVAAAGQSPLPYVKAIAARFDRGRGLAFATALSGVGVGSIVLPMVAQGLVDRFGWRGGYAGLGALTVLIAVPSILISIPTLPPSRGKDPPADGLSGLTPKEAVRTTRFWLLVVGLFLGAVSVNGTIAHVVPLLTDRGVPAKEAVVALAGVGAASIVGRLAAGYLMDRYWAPLVSMVFFAGMIGGITILTFAKSPGTASVATILLGLGLGVEADLVGFLLSRYFGTRAFGALFGYIFGSFILASSLGPVVLGFIFDATGSYNAGLITFGAFSALAACLFLGLGKYPYPAAEPIADY
jgi:MFS family permease